MDTKTCARAGAAVRYDPYALPPLAAREHYEELRAKCPVGHSDQLGGFVALTRYADVAACAADAGTFISSEGAVLPRVPRMTMLEDDGEEHAFWRSLARTILEPGHVRAQEPRIVEIADELIDAFAARGHADLFEEYCAVLPVLVIGAAMGVDRTDLPEVRRLGMAFSDAIADPEAAGPAFMAFAGFLLGLVEARRTAPREDLLTVIAHATREDGTPIGPENTAGLLTGLLLAGHESTASGLCSTIVRTLEDPARAAAVRADAKVLAAVVDESLRIDTPFHWFFRTTSRATTVGGVPIDEGTKVMLNYAAANRDPEVFAAPGEFRLDRPVKGHLAFGRGAHACVGAGLARAQLRLGTARLLERLPDLAVDPGSVERRFSGFMELLPALPATFSPERGRA